MLKCYANNVLVESTLMTYLFRLVFSSESDYPKWFYKSFKSSYLNSGEFNNSFIIDGISLFPSKPASIVVESVLFTYSAACF